MIVEERRKTGQTNRMRERKKRRGERLWLIPSLPSGKEGGKEPRLDASTMMISSGKGGGVFLRFWIARSREGKREKEEGQVILCASETPATPQRKERGAQSYPAALSNIKGKEKREG